MNSHYLQVIGIIIKYTNKCTIKTMVFSNFQFKANGLGTKQMYLL